MESTDAKTDGAHKDACEGNAHEVEGLQSHGHHHHEHGTQHEEPMSPQEAVRSLLLLGQVALDAGDYESATEAYASILKIEPNEVALYNLASFHARGLGTKRDFLEAARLFRQAELMGNERAGKLCAKCMLDYVCEGLEAKVPVDLYAAMAVFVSRVYPEASDQRLEANHGLVAVASTLFSQAKRAEAAKVFRAAAEYGNDASAQYCLGELYSAGVGLRQNDLAALYWFDCAADGGVVEGASEYRDEMLDAMRQGLGAFGFHEAMETLADWCESGTPDVPANKDKAQRWRDLA